MSSKVRWLVQKKLNECINTSVQKLHSMRCCYNAVSYLPNPHKRNPQLAHEGKVYGVFCPTFDAETPQATSHYLSQCWPRSVSPYGVTRSQWVITLWPCEVITCLRSWSVGVQALLYETNVWTNDDSHLLCDIYLGAISQTITDIFENHVTKISSTSPGDLWVGNSRQ